MGFVMPHVITLVAAVVVGVALLFQIIGVATPNWVSIDVGSETFHLGLWEACNPSCSDYSGDLPDFLKACRAFGILGVLVMAASVVCAVLICFMSGNKIFPLVAMVCAAVGAICALIEFAVFVGESDSDARDHLSYSFALTVVACVLCVMAAVLFFVGKSKSAAA